MKLSLLILIITFLALVIFNVFFYFFYTEPGSIITEPPKLVIFPNDEEAHPDSIHEWWYVNGHLTDQNGKKWGFMSILFNNGLSHSVLIDKASRKYYHVSKDSDKFDINNISSPSHKWTNLGNFSYLVSADYDDWSYKMELKANKDPVLNGGGGLIPLGLGGFSYYYSLTDVSMNGESSGPDGHLKLTGKGWIDRQWGRWSYEDDFDSWEWFSIKLDDGTDLMFLTIYIDEKTTRKVLSVITDANEILYGQDYDIEYLNNYRHGGFIWYKDFVLSNRDVGLISLNASLDFTDQFISDTFFEGTGVATGTINGKSVEGLLFYEKIYFK